NSTPPPPKARGSPLLHLHRHARWRGGVSARMHRFRLAGNPRRVSFVPASDAGFIRTEAGRCQHTVQRKIAERVGFDEIANFFDRHIRGDQFRFVWRIHAVITRADSWWA